MLPQQSSDEPREDQAVGVGYPLISMLPYLERKVSPSPSARDPVLLVDCTLSYDEHVTQTVSLCIGSLCQINGVKNPFDARTLERVRKALECSKLYYCSPVWSNTSKQNIAKLQKVQNFAGRILLSKSTSPLQGSALFYTVQQI